ncbi:MAG: hypothetical protein ACKOCO_09155, partial [Bacteroidota bacterium]
WLRYGVNTPSAGHEYLARVQWQKGKVLTASAWWQSETKQANDPAEGASGLISIRRDRFRVHVISKISMSLEGRSRVEWSWYRPEAGGTARGFMAYQEFVFRPVNVHFRALSGMPCLIQTVTTAAYIPMRTTCFPQFRYRPSAGAGAGYFLI